AKSSEVLSKGGEVLSKGNEEYESKRSEELKGLKRQKEAKTIKNRQETGKRQRVKSKSEKSARDHSRISPTQSKKETKKSKTQDQVKGPLVTSVQSLKGLFEDLKIKGQSCQELKMLYKEEKRRKQQQGLNLHNLKLSL
ncbi:hypothetical protein Tco_1097137, partial [Tanacetum coccineum]